MTDIPDLTPEQLESALPASQRRRLMACRFETGDDITALRRLSGLGQADFARALEISVHTLRDWEQDRQRPEGPAVALLRIAARHPGIIRENLGRADRVRQKLARRDLNEDDIEVAVEWGRVTPTDLRSEILGD